MAKIISMGECLIDMIPSSPDNTAYLAKAGGAPANVCACVSRLGGQGYYLGKLSTDGFSDMLYEKMKTSAVLLDYVIRDERYKTALAVVTLSPDGDRSFSFYRHQTADLMLDEGDIPENMLDAGDILHFCSVGLVESPSKYAHKKAITQCRKRGALVSFDVNIRLGLYPNPEACKKTVLEFLPYADIVKVTDEELLFLTGASDEKEGVAAIFEIAKTARVLFLTLGPQGAKVYDRRLDNIYRSAAEVDVVDTTGAGDCFIGSMLYNISMGGLYENAAEYTHYLNFATVAAGRVCGKKGAMEAMPTLEEVTRGL